MTTGGSQESRRKWLGRMLFAAISFSVATIAAPILAFMRPRRKRVSSGLEKIAPYQVSQLVADANGEWPAPFEFAGKPCLLIKTADGTIRAFNANCTHLECTVAFRPDKSDIFCNCHNGIFSDTGQTVSGPPPRPLEEYQVTVQGEQIIVTRS